jgi:nickel-dependent lactate racemase
MDFEFIMSYHRTPLKYGNTSVDEFVPLSVKKTKVLQIEGYEPDFENLEQKLQDVLDNPLGTNPFDDFVKESYKECQKILFMVDDKTRPNIHTKILLPLISERLLKIGIPKTDIGIIVASGSHIPASPDELESRILGSDLYREWKNNILTHDCDAGNRNVGVTSMGTPILIDQQVLDACMLIPLSDSEYHYFAGQAGTVKQFCPGVAGRETIRINHPKMFDLELGFKPTCRLGNTEGNPVIQDMIEITNKMKEKIPIFCVDSIVNNGEIVYLQAGDIIECHKAASGPLEELRVVEVDVPADLVFVSVGELGVNLYQAGKGIHAAWNTVRHDKKGWIVLLAPCEDGIGSSGYEEAIERAKDMVVPAALKFVIQEYCNEKTFKIGNQKPVDLFRILLDVEERNIKIVTELDTDMLSEIYRMEGFNPKDSDDVQRILRELVQRYLKINPNPRIYVLNDPSLLVQVENQIN